MRNDRQTNKNPIWLILLGLVLLFPILAAAQSDVKISHQPWEEMKHAGKGSITIFWNETPPFISSNKKGELEGIEYELILGFKNFLKEEYGTEVELIWKKESEFNEVYKRILNKDKIASFGASGFSITDERQLEVGFSPSYMTDISVMISSQAVPIARNFEDFINVASGLTAVTVKQSTFEQDLLTLKHTGSLLYPFKYVSGGNQIILEIVNRPDAFGIIDLAIYLDLIKKNPTIKLKRQNLFTKIRKGFGLIYPFGGDWAAPLDQYFQKEQFRENFQKTIARYINPDDYNFIEGLPDSDFQIAILTREKEIQQQHINEEIRIRNLGIALLVMAGLSLVLILILFRRSKLLYKEIEQQRKNIEQQNLELEIKNKKLEEFTFTNAHKLRAPVATIIGLVQLYNYHNAHENTRIIELLKQSSPILEREVKAIQSRLKEEGWV